MNSRVTEKREKKLTEIVGKLNDKREILDFNYSY